MNRFGVGLMVDESDHIHEPGNKGLPEANSIGSFLFHCYEEHLSVEKAIERCRKFGMKDVESEQIEEAYKEFSRLAEKLEKLFASHFENKTDAGVD